MICTVLSLVSYLAFAALSWQNCVVLKQMSERGDEPTAAALVQASVLRHLFLGSSVVFAVLSLA